ncbi:proton-translocating transhydrogenase family protein [Thermochromatium tepidum]|uniref:proton-translocating NAD(P)(+) transhydrogenase n=1 Tax=Thermochromatium tepidum ATCC 43061 TaxID=316276 RepID=A0A6I6ECL9_THETI|nr:proton-translocating transhydrogenase family protein [Thermochromatium tepidum]QGU31910.1 NAD(P) transhydrogenase subunit alpha [Thermochromatium tepidum ATCC 43061]
MSEALDPSLIALYVFVLACFIGYWVIWGVTPSLHTPLVALTNAISGIVLIGALLVAGDPQAGLLIQSIGFVAVLLASINVFGGFLVTHRMLSMFKKKKH